MTLLGLLGCPRYDPSSAPAGPAPGAPASAAPEPTAEVASAPFEDWYPADITPPEGTQYPCALTALPRDLPGVPAADHRYLNHTYALILGATQAKLPMLQRVWQATADQQVDLPAELATYQAAIDEARTKLEAEPVPPGLEAFHGKVLEALALQRTFFAKAVEHCQAHADQAGIPDGRKTSPLWDQVIAIPEGKQASGILIAAWGDMQRRYRGWTPALKDSVYHHLCALDLF